MTTLYDPTTWVSGVTPLSAPNMNKIETGVRAGSPIGSVMMWPLDVAPTGWLLCDGSTVSRATYPELWSFVDANLLVAAGMYGPGDGSTTFDLPDATGRFIRSPSAGDGGATGGADTHSHVNPSTGSAGSHGHTNSPTGSAGGHSHTNPNTGISTAGHLHGFTNTPNSTVVVQSGSGTTVASSTHAHDTGLPTTHVHTQGVTNTVASHSHSVGVTDSAGTHSHSQNDTAASSSLPSFLEMWFIVAT